MLQQLYLDNIGDKINEKFDEKASSVSQKITSTVGSFQCPSCGSNIPDDESKLILSCPFCGATVTKQQTTTDKVIGIIKDPIKQYQDRKAKEEEEAREIRRKQEEERRKHPFRSWIPIIACALVLAAVVYFVAYKPHQDRVNRLEAIVVEIKQDIADGKYETARAKTNNLYLNDDWSSGDNERWDHERETLLALIDAAEKDNK